VIRKSFARHRAATASLFILSFLVVACGGLGSSPSASSVASSVASASVLPSAAATGSGAASEAQAPEPSGDLGAFICTLPVNDPGTATRSQITNVRVGTHEDYDRITFEFDAGIPQYRVEAATPPFSADPSGLPLEVAGSAFWRITLIYGTKVTPDGAVTYSGSTNFVPGFAALVQLKEGGDFEAVSTWYVGLTDTSCIRVLTLTDPDRLVIDIQH
jgi:hypothetical protein